MLLSELLHRLAAAFPSVEIASTPELVDYQRRTFAEALRKAALHAEGQEHAIRMLEATQIPPIHADALVVGLSTGKVSILPVHRTLIAHGFDDRPDTPDRRFGEDQEILL